MLSLQLNILSSFDISSMDAYIMKELSLLLSNKHLPLMLVVTTNQALCCQELLKGHKCIAWGLAGLDLQAHVISRDAHRDNLAPECAVPFG